MDLAAGTILNMADAGSHAVEAAIGGEPAYVYSGTTADGGSHVIYALEHQGVAVTFSLTSMGTPLNAGALSDTGRILGSVSWLHPGAGTVTLSGAADVTMTSITITGCGVPSGSLVVWEDTTHTYMVTLQGSRLHDGSQQLDANATPQSPTGLVSVQRLGGKNVVWTTTTATVTLTNQGRGGSVHAVLAPDPAAGAGASGSITVNATFTCPS